MFELYEKQLTFDQNVIKLIIIYISGGKNYVSTGNAAEGKKNTKTFSNGTKDYSAKGKSFTRNNGDGQNRSKNGAYHKSDRSERTDRKPYSKPGEKRDFGSNNKGNGKSAGNKNFKPKFNNYGYGKDEDEAPKREFRSKNTKESKTKDLQQDKIDIQNRLEKEKKVMQKKNANKKAPAKHKPQAKAKRSNNIDWTREYENDSYDDDYLDSYL